MISPQIVNPLPCRSIKSLYIGLKYSAHNDTYLVPSMGAVLTSQFIFVRGSRFGAVIVCTLPVGHALSCGVPFTLTRGTSYWTVRITSAPFPHHHTLRSHQPRIPRHSLHVTFWRYRRSYRLRLWGQPFYTVLSYNLCPDPYTWLILVLIGTIVSSVGKAR